MLYCLLSHELIPTGWKTRSLNRSDEGILISWRRVWEIKLLSVHANMSKGNSFQLDGWSKSQPMRNKYNNMEDLAAIFQLSHKNQNRLQKAYNDNGQPKCQPPVRDTPGPLQGPHPTVLGVGVPDGGLARPSKLKVIHWNAGSKLWENKLDMIENLLSDKKPDLCFISKANLWSHVPDYEMVIPGHHLILPSTMTSLNHARIVLIVRDGSSQPCAKEGSD